MQKDDRDLLEVLKFELQFLHDGGYGRSPRTPWRPQLIFEDSPTCMNFNTQRQSPCSACVLIDLVPPEFRCAQVPCRHIPFDESGDTLDSLYRYGDEQEIEGVVEHWLETTIHRIEQERAAAAQSRGEQPLSPAGTLKGTPLYGKQEEGPNALNRASALHPKCANPVCPKAFHWTAGGKFFRFRPDSEAAAKCASTADSPCGIHGVRHYWLCERCAQMFTLVYDDECGVVLKTLWPELPVPEEPKELAATTGK